MNILDDAFALAKKAVTASSHVRAKERLHEMHATAQWDEIVDSWVKACSLAESSYDFAERCRNGITTDGEAIIEMRSRHPGFLDATYRAALSHGYFISR